MRHTLLTLALLAAFSASASVAHHAPLTALPSATIAKHGADDPTGDDRGDHGSGHARRGADDPAGDDRGDHGSGHARRGADDPVGDDRGDHGSGHA